MAINQIHALVLGLCVYCNLRVTRKRVSIQKESNAGESAMTNVLDLNTSNQLCQINKELTIFRKQMSVVVRSRHLTSSTRDSRNFRKRELDKKPFPNSLNVGPDTMKIK